jgi:hypothetical protein
MLQLYLDRAPSTAARSWRDLNYSVRPMRSFMSTISPGLTRSQNSSRSIPMAPYRPQRMGISRCRNPMRSCNTPPT